MEAALRGAFEACIATPERALSLPPVAYHDPALFAREQEHVFGRGWIALGRADRVKAAGDYEAIEVAGRPIILTRDKGGQLHALANSCRHRGARLVEGRGTLGGLRCPFHAWLYRMDGSFAAAPRMEGAAFEACEKDLHRYPLAERLGFAFVSFDPKPPAIDDWLGDFEAVHGDWPLAELVQTRSWIREFAFDWKGFIEVFNEYYHLPYVHRDSIDGVYNDPDAGDVVTGQFASQYGSTEGTGGLLEEQQAHALPPMPGLKGRARNGVRYTWAFPTMTFAASTDAMWIYEAYPVRPGVCRVTQSTCFHPETMALGGFAAREAVYYERLDAALDEDIPALENQFAGLRSPEATQGPFQVGLEPNVAAFARWYAERMVS